MNRTILLAASLAFAAAAHAQVAGRVLVAAGDVSAARGGRDVPLASGATIEPGDLVKTGTASAAQIRFTDASVVALRAGTQFAVEQYRFTGQDEGLSQAAYRLLRGGLRTITGLIGSQRRDRYRVVSPTATLGIRGTGFALVSCQDDCLEADGSAAPNGTYGVVFDGRVVVANDAGEREFGIEEAFFVADLRTPAQPLVARPAFLRDRLEARARRDGPRDAAQQQAAAREAAARVASLPLATREALAQAGLRPLNVLGTAASPIVVSEQRDADGNIALLGAGLGAGTAFSSAVGDFALVDGGRGAVVLLDPERGKLDAFSFNGGQVAGDRLGEAVVDNGGIVGDGAVTWGRWTSGAAVRVNGVTGQPTTGVHFFYGNLTPESFFGTLPTTATSVRYEYHGGTRPTDGTGAPGAFLDGLFIVNFLQRQIGGAISYRTGDTTWDLVVPATPITARAGFVGFAHEGAAAGRWTRTANGQSQTGAIDSYTVTGLFLGSRAQNLGIAYGTIDAQAGRSAGASVFRCAGTGCR